jgi:hypothetical protein
MGNMSDNENVMVNENRIKTFRWFFYIGLSEVVLFFAVPSLGFPIEYVPYILAIAALTLGLVVAVFFLLVNVCGLFVDRKRSLLYASMIAVMTLWLLWATVSWSYIEHMNYLLH